MNLSLGIIQLTLNRGDLVLPFLEQMSSLGSQVKVVLGDTGSTEADLLKAYDQWGHRYGRFSIVRSLSYHFSKNNNELARRALDTSHYLFLNNDVIFSSTAQVEELYRKHLDEEKKNPRLVSGLVMNFGLKTQTDKTRWEPGLLQHAGVHFQPEPWITPVHPLAGEQASVGWSCREFPATTGAALLISRDLFWRVGGFDEAFEKEAQDVDLCLKVHRLGGRSLVWNLGPVIHLENATRPRGDSSSADRLRLLEKWKNYIELNFLGGQETPWPRERRL